MQNCAARLVTGSKKYDHITPLMKQLHWLPISQRIIYKIVLITYKSLNGSAPHYINNMLKPYTPSANLRSSSKGLLTIPSVKLVNYGERSFSYAAPKLWNELPEYIRKSETLPIFKTRLKTHLFKQYYDYRARNNGRSTINDRQEIVFDRRRSNVAVHLDRQEIYLTIV